MSLAADTRAILIFRFDPFGEIGRIFITTEENRVSSEGAMGPLDAGLPADGRSDIGWPSQGQRSKDSGVFSMLNASRSFKSTSNLQTQVAVAQIRKNQVLPARLELAIFGLLLEFQAHTWYETDALPTEPRKHCMQCRYDSSVVFGALIHTRSRKQQNFFKDVE